MTLFCSKALLWCNWFFWKNNKNLCCFLLLLISFCLFCFLYVLGSVVSLINLIYVIHSCILKYWSMSDTCCNLSCLWVKLWFLYPWSYWSVSFTCCTHHVLASFPIFPEPKHLCYLLFQFGLCTWSWYQYYSKAPLSSDALNYAQSREIHFCLSFFLMFSIGSGWVALYKLFDWLHIMKLVIP